MSTSPEQEIKEGSDSNIEENESIGENIFIGSLKCFRTFYTAAYFLFSKDSGIER